MASLRGGGEERAGQLKEREQWGWMRGWLLVLEE
jgi:hypothetical protein